MQDNAAPATTTLSPVNTVASRWWWFLKYSVCTFFVILTVAYGIITTALLILKWVVGESWWPVALFNSLFPIVLLPVFVLLPGSLLIRRWRLALFTLPALVVFIFSYGGLFIPRSVDVDPDAPQVTILTYNIHAETENLQPLVNIIQHADADIVALQELSSVAAEVFAAEYANTYPYQALHPGDPHGVFGQGVLSRYPIKSDTYWNIYLGHQRLEIDIDGTPVIFYNTHPIQPLVNSDGFALHAQEISDVLTRAEQDTGPLILAGDFNMTDQFEDYRRVSAQFRDTYREIGRGLGFTFPAVRERFFIFEVPFRIVRLDYVFHNEQFRAISARVWPTSGGSDHSPLYAELALVNTE